MQTPLQISFRHTVPSPAVEARIRELVERLERFNHRIQGCHVIVAAPSKHHRTGAAFDVHIDLSLPDGQIEVRSPGEKHEAHMDVYVALRDAFDSAQRLLRECALKHGGDVKHHHLRSLG